MKTSIPTSDTRNKMVQPVDRTEPPAESSQRAELRKLESEEQSCWLLRSFEGMKKALWFSNLQNSN